MNGRTIGSLVIFIALLMGAGCESAPSKEAATSNPIPAPQRMSKTSEGSGPSGAPVIGYRLITSKRPGWAYVIVKHVPNTQELVDLAFALHKSFPVTRFEILNDGSRVNEMDRQLEDPVKDPVYESWLNIHDFGTLNNYNARWYEMAIGSRECEWGVGWKATHRHGAYLIFKYTFLTNTAS